LWSRNFFIQKANQEKLVHQSLGFSPRMTRQKNKKSTRKPIPPPPPNTKPRFYSYVPFEDSVFFNKNNKEIPTKKKRNSFFQSCLFLKKREKNLKEKKKS
jgi:hypothetical protein